MRHFAKLFHTLFYIDYYLEDEESAFKEQEFQKSNASLFKDYEELEYKKAKNLYTKKECAFYLKHILKKCRMILDNSSDESLKEEASIRPTIGSKLELHIYSIRHIQHHSAQLGLRLQMLTGKEMAWFSSGWKD